MNILLFRTRLLRLHDNSLLIDETGFSKSCADEYAALVEFVNDTDDTVEESHLIEQPHIFKGL